VVIELKKREEIIRKLRGERVPRRIPWGSIAEAVFLIALVVSAALAIYYLRNEGDETFKPPLERQYRWELYFEPENYQDSDRPLENLVAYVWFPAEFRDLHLLSYRLTTALGQNPRGNLLVVEGEVWDNTLSTGPLPHYYVVDVQTPLGLRPRAAAEIERIYAGDILGVHWVMSSPENLRFCDVPAEDWENAKILLYVDYAPEIPVRFYVHLRFCAYVESLEPGLNWRLHDWLTPGWYFIRGNLNPAEKVQ
jgi:hypothetical protein